MLCNSSQFLLLVSVPVFLPGLALHRLRLRADWTTAWFVAHDGLNSFSECSDIILMEKVFVNNILNPLDFLRPICHCRKVAAVQLPFLELAVLRLKVFRINVGRRVAVQELTINIILEDVPSRSGLIRLAVGGHKTSHISICCQQLLRGGGPVRVFIFSRSDDVDAIRSF